MIHLKVCRKGCVNFHVDALCIRGRFSCVRGHSCSQCIISRGPRASGQEQLRDAAGLYSVRVAGDR